MFDDLRRNGLSAGMAQFNSMPVNNCFGQAAYNNNYAPPPFTYGCTYGEPYSGYIPPTPDITISQESYKYDPLNFRWCKEISNNKGKIKAEPLTGEFSIIYQYKNKSPDDELRFAILQYMVKDKIYAALVPKEDYIKDSFHKYLKEIFRYPGCSRSKFNALVAFLLQSVPTQDIMMFPHQGWNATEEGAIVFASDPPNLNIPHSLISPSVARRKLPAPEHSQQEIILRWKNFFSKNPSLMFMGYYRIGSLFQYFLREAGLDIKQFLIAEPSQEMSKEQLVATLATNDTINFPIPTLGADEDTIRKELEYTHDGIALYTDDCFADEEKVMLAGLKSIIRNVRGETANQNLGNGIPAVVSPNAAYAATRLASENVIVINTDGTEVMEDANTIKGIVGEMDVLALSTGANRMGEFKAFIADIIPNLHKNLSEHPQGESLETIVMILIVEFFFRQFLGFAFLDDESFKSLLKIVDCKNDRIMNACEAVEHEFFALLSGMVRSKTIVPVLKRRGMTFDNDGIKFIVDGNRMYIPVEIIKAVLAQMTTTRSLESLMKALRQTKVLESTDGNSHPIEVHNSAGEHQRLYLYDISAEALDADILYKLHNIVSESFLLDEGEVPKKDFLAILRDAEGRIAGRQICYTDEENGHSCITGQSGWGKTYLLSQLLAKCCKLGHRVVVFDSSDSFTYEALCRNLSKRFVDSYVTIHDIDKDGIPVDLFALNHNASLPTKKKQLLGILQAAIGELSPPQSNALRTVLSKVIAELDSNDRITCDSIINKLNGIDKEFFTPENVKDYLEPLLDELEACDYELSALDECDRHNCKTILRRLNGGGKNEGEATLNSLLNRIEPLFEDIEECGMADRSWGEFIRSSNSIIVIRTNSAYTESGNQLIDMLLATLYNYQHDNPQIALDVFIDELQNQNFSKTSPIRKIMKEGRKIHLSFFGATQDYYARNTELGSVMGKAGTQIFLRPTPNSANVVAAELRFNKAEMERFDSMMRGDIIVKANLFDKKLGRNVPTTLGGRVDDYPKIPDNYYGNVL